MVAASDITAIFDSIESARAEQLHGVILESKRTHKDKSLTLKNARLILRRDGLLTFALRDAKHKLPAGLWYKGGVARNALRSLFALSPFPVRDVDVVSIGNVSEKKLRALSQHLCPEDTKFGHGIEQCRTRRHYFESRDFSINEILYNGDRIVCTERALSAVQNGCVEVVTSKVTDLVLLKGLRLIIREGVLASSRDFLGMCEYAEVSKFAFELNCARAGNDKQALINFVKKLHIGLVEKI